MAKKVSLMSAPLNTVLHGVPIPKLPGGPGRGRITYPFADMQPGDCIVTDKASIATIAISWAWERKLPIKWAKRALGDNRYGLWRVE